MGVAHTRVEIFGTAAGGIETWSTSFSTPPVPGVTNSDMESYALTAAGLFQTHFWTPATNDYSTTTRWTGTRARALDAAGHVVASGEQILSPSQAGGAGSPCLPLEVAVVLSLRTDIPGGRGRGRMYLPGPTVNKCVGNGLLDSSTQTSWIGYWQAFFNAWNASPDTLTASVASGVGGSVAAVSSIRLGNVFDSQRRRRNTQPETYQVALVIP